jgi:hypothetical protein
MPPRHRIPHEFGTSAQSEFAPKFGAMGLNGFERNVKRPSDLHGGFPTADPKKHLQLTVRKGTGRI